ncbi:MAG: CoA-binding protein [Gammaproteobacteria bacterium]|nr:CoA-binding protein [Gammaproteobacteria bacterium]
MMSSPKPCFDSKIDVTAITKLFTKTVNNKNTVLTEKEVYSLLEYATTSLSPVNACSTKQGEISDLQLSRFKGDKVILKIVSRNISHKTEAGGVLIVANESNQIHSSINNMIQEVPATFANYLSEQSAHEYPVCYRGLTGNKLHKAIASDIEGVLVVDFITPDSKAFGSELLIGIRNSREFGLTISAGLGGSNTELFAENFISQMAVVSASTEFITGSSFFDLFKKCLAYKSLSGQNRGQNRLISDDQLIAVFDTMIALAKHFSPTNHEAAFVIEELEINPFAIAKGQLIPLDGFCRIARPNKPITPRPIEKIEQLLHPSSIGIIGVSAKKMNFGRIILNNLISSGYKKSKLCVLRPDQDEIDGVDCVPDLSSLNYKLDLLIMAVGANAVYGLVEEIIEKDAAETVMLIPGGLGETEASKEPAARMNKSINDAHNQLNGGPIFLGGNCLGIVSHPGHYDSWFISEEKLPRLHKKQLRNTALISQSGAFIITRLSQNPWFDPAYMVAIGNQNDITHGDMLRYFADNPKVDVIGIYVEGFNDLDGLDCVKAVQQAVIKGKEVIIYKAGRSKAGKNATMGHTASIAGDHKICEELLQQAGAITCSSISEFNDIYYLASMLHHKQLGGNRLGAISSAGYETVAIADSIIVDDCSLQMANLQPGTLNKLNEVLRSKKLDRLMEVRNPFDITPGADDQAHLHCTDIMCDDSEVDMVVLGLNPLSPTLRSLTARNKPDFDINSEYNIVIQLPKIVAKKNKPIIAIMDVGDLYMPVMEKLRDSGVVVFNSNDRAVAALTKYTEGRFRAEGIAKALKDSKTEK